MAPSASPDVPERSSKIGEQIRVGGLALHREPVILDGFGILPTVIVQIGYLHQRVEILGIVLQGCQQGATASSTIAFCCSVVS